MNKLSYYLETATNYEGDGKRIIGQMYRENPSKFEEMWMETIRNENSLDLNLFEELLEKRGLYLQIYSVPRVPHKYRGIYEPPIYMELRIYPLEINQYVACLKLTIN